MPPEHEQLFHEYKSGQLQHEIDALTEKHGYGQLRGDPQTNLGNNRWIMKPPEPQLQMKNAGPTEWNVVRQTVEAPLLGPPPTPGFHDDGRPFGTQDPNEFCATCDNSRPSLAQIEDAERELRIVEALEADDNDEWTEYTDPPSGRSWYFNAATGESSWTKPVAATKQPQPGGRYPCGNSHVGCDGV